VKIKIGALLFIFLCTSCATQLNGSVTRFHTLDGATKSFAIFPLETQKDSLEFRTYARLLSQQLTAKGWKEEFSDNADVAVFLVYSIDGKTQTRSFPIMKQVPFGPAVTSGTVSPSGQIQATTTQATTGAVAGYGSRTDTVYVRDVSVKMFSLPVWRSSQTMEPVFEGAINSTGSTGQLAIVMPTLIEALMKDFPGKSGSTVQVQLPIAP
jgi:hypothetical protein